MNEHRLKKIVEDPYRGIKWEMRIAQIIDTDGNIKFQDEVEFPDYFSDNDLSIVASKYLCNNAKVKEISFKNMIERVSTQIVDWGVDSQYFKTVEQRNEFEAMLKYLQVHQMAAFNSPVYFNCGLYERPQTAACFLLNVEDNMTSIFDWISTEATIFKGGSGSGINLSTLRSSKERVKGGGFASGPVSFMKVSDVAAGIIKSGGTLRRSAKLACLNCDHPDILKFITCKEQEENKMHILKAAGIKPEEGYEMSDHVYLQNTNISVRLSDQFMVAVEDDQEWETKYVLTGNTCEKFKARDIMNMIAEQAWKTGDPGIMFDDAFNRWNTCSEDGRINTTNPCLPLWAPVLTPEGYRRFGGIKNKVFIDGTEYNCSNLIKTGEDREIYEVVLKSGLSIYATDEHKITTKRGDVELKDLKFTDEVKVDYNPISYEFDQNEFERGFVAGYLFADGSIWYNKIGNAQIDLGLGHKELSHEQDIVNILNKTLPQTTNKIMFKQSKNKYKNLRLYKKDLCEYVLKNIFRATNKDSFDLISEDKTVSYQIGFIHAMISFDGNVNLGHLKNITLDQAGDSGYRILKQIQLILASLGIYSHLGIGTKERVDNRGYLCQTMYKLSIKDVSIFNNTFPDLFSDTKQIKLEQNARNRTQYQKVNRSKVYQKIKSAKKLKDREDVYDINVPDVNHFVTSGAVVHNCGEVAFLDQTSCNLAALNLLSFFYLNEDMQPIFDIELFLKAIETLITAQEIIIDHSSYPTNKITENSKKYRPLGLGFSNLGGLLMYLGLPYDSNEARTIASALTAIITGHAYAISGKIADRKGAFKGFKHNQDRMYTVLGQHIQKLKDPTQKKSKSLADRLTQYAHEAWDKVAERIDNNGPFRNAQVTVQQPTGCVRGDTLLLTNEGLVEIQDLCPSNILHENQWFDHDICVMQENTIEDSTQFYYNGDRRTIKITTDHGFFIEGTPNHQVRIVDSSGDYVWKRLDQLHKNDQLAIRVGGHKEILGDKDYIQLRTVNQSKHVVTIPNELTEDLAFILGYFMGNGHIKEGIGMSIADCHVTSLLELDRCFQSVFGIKHTRSQESRGAAKCYFYGSRIIAKFFEVNEFVKDKCNHGEGAESAFIPKQILQSRTSVVQAFLRGLFDSDGTISNKTKTCPIIEMSTVSEKLATQVHTLLVSLGIMSSKTTSYPRTGFKSNRKVVYRIRIKSSKDSEDFVRQIGFASSKKLDRCRNVKSKIGTGNVLFGKSAWRDFRSHLGNIGCQPRLDFNTRVNQERGSLFWAESMIQLYPQLQSSKIAKLLQKNIRFSKISKIESNCCKTFDITVPKNNTYVANNIISHNTVSFLMGCATTGIEPEYSLVRYKKLAGTSGGTLKLVNPIIKASLQNLRYSKDTIERIIDCIVQDGHLDNCDYIKDEHRAIFDCAATPVKDGRTIPYMGHIKMMEAVQSYISGSISKTINVPESATVDDIKNIYMYAWKHGLKSITIYRDNSKVDQALTTVLEKKLCSKSERERPPRDRNGKIHKFAIGPTEGYLICGEYPDGRLCEVFIDVAKEGSTLSGLLDTLSIQISLALQHGVPLKDIVRKLQHQTFEPHGITQNCEMIPFCTSIVDYVGRYIGMKYLSDEDKYSLGLKSKKQENSTVSEICSVITSGPSCSHCGSLMTRKGSCYLCLNCGFNEGACG